MVWYLYDNGLRHERVKPLLDVLLHIFDDISSIQNTGNAINNMYLHSQPSKPHVLNLQNDVIISKWR